MIPIITEGKYDKIKLLNITKAPVIVTDGFRIFKSKKKLEYIKELSKKTGVIIFTDSDKAGFQIRNRLKTIIKNVGGKVYDAYIPDIYGKESRKDKPSAEGKVGVEGISDKILLEILNNAVFQKENLIFNDNQKFLDNTRFITDGLSGNENSKIIRKLLLKEFNLPENLNTKSLINAVNIMFTEEQYITAISKIKGEFNN